MPPPPKYVSVRRRFQCSSTDHRRGGRVRCYPCSLFCRSRNRERTPDVAAPLHGTRRARTCVTCRVRENREWRSAERTRREEAAAAEITLRVCRPGINHGRTRAFGNGNKFDGGICAMGLVTRSRARPDRPGSLRRYRARHVPADLTPARFLHRPIDGRLPPPHVSPTQAEETLSQFVFKRIQQQSRNRRTPKYILVVESDENTTWCDTNFAGTGSRLFFSRKYWQIQFFNFFPRLLIFPTTRHIF